MINPEVRKVRRTLSGKPQKNFKKIMIFVSVCVIAVLVPVIIISCENRNRLFAGREYYFVYTDSSSSIKDLSPHAERVKALGGAGEIEEIHNKYYLVVGVYAERADAEEIRENLSGEFKDAGILSVNSKKVASKTVKKIKSEPKLYEACRFLDDLADLSVEISMEYMSGKLTENEIQTKFIDLRLQAEEFINSVVSESDLGKEITKELGREKVLIETFLNAFFQSNKRQSLLLSLAVNLTKNKCELTKYL